MEQDLIYLCSREADPHQEEYELRPWCIGRVIVQAHVAPAQDPQLPAAEHPTLKHQTLGYIDRFIIPAIAARLKENQGLRAYFVKNKGMTQAQSYGHVVRIKCRWHENERASHHLPEGFDVDVCDVASTLLSHLEMQVSIAESEKIGTSEIPPDDQH